MITQSYLQQLLDYNPDTGIFIWKPRPSDKRFNSRYAGKEAGFKRPKGYRMIALNGRNYFAHRLAWLYVKGVWPVNQIDHDNNRRDDNSFDNLNDATVTENNRNRSISARSKSGRKGVYYSHTKGVWMAHMEVNERRMRKERRTFQEAVAIREQWEHEYHGKFRCENVSAWCALHPPTETSG